MIWLSFATRTKSVPLHIRLPRTFFFFLFLFLFFFVLKFSLKTLLAWAYQQSHSTRAFTVNDKRGRQEGGEK